MKFSIHCKKCDTTVSDRLEAVPEDFEPEWEDEMNIVPRGKYWIAHDLPTAHVNGNAVIHLSDVKNLNYHKDLGRRNGCCGLDGCDGPNLVCGCGEDIATEVSDCWTSYYAHFESEKTYLKEETTTEPVGGHNSGGCAPSA